jgi:hypothetical protein
MNAVCRGWSVPREQEGDENEKLQTTSGGRAIAPVVQNCGFHITFDCPANPKAPSCFFGVTQDYICGVGARSYPARIRKAIVLSKSILCGPV